MFRLVVVGVGMISFVVKRINFGRDIIVWVSARHYSGSCPRATRFAFGLFDGERMIGVCLFGLPTRNQARLKYDGMLELTRLFVEDGTPKNTESYFISRCLNSLKKEEEILGVISYADPNVGHQGIVYKASNFTFLSKTQSSYHYLNTENKRVHIKGVWDRAKKNGITEKEQAAVEGLTKVSDQPKNLYLYVLNKSKIDQKFWIKDFFSKWSRELAWVYGLILGDGNISLTDGSYRVSLCGNFDTVAKFCRLLKIPGGPKKKSSIYEAYIDDKWLVFWFHQRGISGKKSHSLPWPDDLPEEFKWDFIRGLIDTDGQFVWDRTKSLSEKAIGLVLGFSSSTESFVKRFKDETGITQSVLKKAKNMKGRIFYHYSIKANYTQSVDVLKKAYDCPSSIRNEERYQRYVKGSKSLSARVNMKCKICGATAHSNGLCHLHTIRRDIRERASCSVPGCSKFVMDKKNGLCTEHFYKKRSRENPLHNPDIAKRFMSLRKAAGMSQINFAQQVFGAKKQGRLGNVEIGKGFFNRDQIKLIAQFFKVSEDWLINGDSNEAVS
ncbi:MAG: helix-turn-helix domain-containing protein [Bacteroidetes bacterium]|nr:helix-turn-helix domain-containing protein [Bacteroidota bacterium]